MSGLLLVAAFAQAATATGPAPAATDSTQASHLGSSTYLDAEVGAGYSSNPFQKIDSSTGQGFGRFSLHAVHTRVTDRTTTVLSAYGQDTTYTGHYGSAQSFDVNARHDAAVNEKLRIFVTGDVTYDRGGQLDTQILSVPNVPLLPGSTLPPVLLAPGSDFLTVTGRSYREDGEMGAHWTLSPRDGIDFTAGVNHTIFKQSGLDTRFTTIPLSIGYDRQISEQATLGARIAGQFTHYSETAINPSTNVNVITPEVTGLFKFSETLTLSGDVGASFSKIDNIIGTRHSTGIAADAALCSNRERSQLCARASVQNQASTTAGPARVMTAEVDYSRRLNETDTLQFSFAANRYSNPVVLVTGAEFSRATYIRAAADYSRRLGHRWFAGVDLSARKVTQNGPDPNADFSGSIFIRYRFGDVQ